MEASVAPPIAIICAPFATAFVLSGMSVSIQSPESITFFRGRGESPFAVSIMEKSAGTLFQTVTLRLLSISNHAEGSLI